MISNSLRPTNIRILCACFLIALIASNSPVVSASISPSISSRAHPPEAGAPPIPAMDAGLPGTTAHQREQEPLIFSDDFEAYGDSSRWNRNLPFPVQSVEVSSGNFAARFAANGGAPVYGRERFEHGHSTLYVRLDFLVLEYDATPVTLLQLRAGDMSSIVTFQITRDGALTYRCLLYTSPSPRDKRQSRMPSSA